MALIAPLAGIDLCETRRKILRPDELASARRTDEKLVVDDLHRVAGQGRQTFDVIVAAGGLEGRPVGIGEAGGGENDDLPALRRNKIETEAFDEKVVAERNISVGQNVARLVFPQGIELCVIGDFHGVARQGILSAADEESGAVEDKAAFVFERGRVEHARSRHDGLGPCVGEEQCAQRSGDFLLDAVGVGRSLLIVDSVQRRLHGAGRYAEGLKVKSPDAEGHGADDQKQIQQIAQRRGVPRQGDIFHALFGGLYGESRVFVRSEVGEDAVELRLLLFRKKVVSGAADGDEFRQIFATFAVFEITEDHFFSPEALISSMRLSTASLMAAKVCV